MIEPIRYWPKPARAILRYGRLVRTFKNWPRFLSFKWGFSSGPIRLETRRGLRMDVSPPVTFVFKDVFLHEAYGFSKVLARLPPDPVVVDIGANVGFFSLFAFHRRPKTRCLSIEPVTSNFQALNRHRHLNETCRWLALNLAVAGRDGVIRIVSDVPGQLDTSARVCWPDDLIEEPCFHEESVAARSLATLFAEQNVRHCHWLKLDCEGSEYEILYAAPPELLRRIEMISLETHSIDSADRNAGALGRFLVDHGYRLYTADDAVMHAVRV